MRYLILALCLLPLVALADINTAVMTSGNQTVNGVKTFTETVVGSVTGNAGTLGGHDSTYFQPAATAINTGNISAQSVDYAATAGDAPDLTGRAVFQSYTSHPRAATTVQNTWAAFQNFSGGAKASSDVITPGDVRYYMDGQGGRPTLAQWQSDQTTTDVTDVIQAAIDSGHPVKFPAGTFLYSHITLRDLTQLLGSGMRSTILKAKTGADPYSVTIDLNYVRSVRIEDIWFVGNAANPAQGCWYFKGVYPDLPATQQGGLWYSTFRNVRIDTYSGNSIWLRGDTDIFKLPMQFLTFENIVVYRSDSGDGKSRSLLATGETVQCQFINCELAGVYGTKPAGANVELSREFLNAGVYGGSTVGGAAVSDNAPVHLKFINGAIQYSQYGFDIDRAQNIEISTWFENLSYAIKQRVSSRGLTITNSHFANAGTDGSNGGYLLSTGPGCYAVFENNDITGTYDTGLVGTDSYGISERSNVWVTAAGVARSVGLTPQLSVAGGGSIDLKSYRTAGVSGGATVLTTISSTLAIGETATLRVTSGQLLISNTGNIQPQYASANVTVMTGETITIMRQDLAGIKEYQIIAAPRRLWGTTAQLPALQTGEAGILYWDTTIGAPKYSFGDAAPGTWATGLTTGFVRASSVAFASLGTVPAAGTMKYCTDCTTAATCAGSGTGHMAVSNGTNWTCQ